MPTFTRMGPIELLRAQHQMIRELCEMIPRAEGGHRVALCAKLAEELTVHLHLEEGIFYPEAKARGIAAEIEKSVVEHEDVKELVSLMLTLKTNDPRLLETVARIGFLVGKHIEEEERVVFPRFLAHEDEARLATIGEQLARTQDDLRNEDVLAIAEAHPTADQP